MWLSDGFELGDGFAVGDGVAVKADFAFAEALSVAFDTVAARAGPRCRWTVPAAAALGDIRARGLVRVRGEDARAPLAGFTAARVGCRPR
ncbi:hypothetical protein ACWEQN_47510 [Streptomyces sp. NPDC004129]|uniref:hypothetical protein n=1 Tax=Streptomyces sp. NPDC004533 TaxID=3154278 RepID=UPI0033B3947E